MTDRPSPMNSPFGPLGALRRFVRPPRAAVAGERCELCRAVLAPEHQHLIEPASRRIVCACDACAILFDRPTGAAYRRVPRRGRLLVDFDLPDGVWDELSIPINMAFLFFSSPAARIVAIYPSPAGPTESLLPLTAWHSLARANPVLGQMQPDVEALLVNRLGARRGFAGHEHYLAPIDACYQLVGLIRLRWRGLGGGTEAWDEISRFFGELKARSLPTSAREAADANEPAEPRAAPLPASNAAREPTCRSIP